MKTMFDDFREVLDMAQAPLSSYELFPAPCPSCGKETWYEEIGVCENCDQTFDTPRFDEGQL